MTKKGWLIVLGIFALIALPYIVALFSMNASPQTDACARDFLKAVEKQDYREATALFLPCSEEDEKVLQKELSTVFFYVDGDCKSIKKIDRLNITKGESGQEQFTTYEVKTKKDRYYLAIRILVAEQKAQNGILSLYIIRASEWDALHPDYPYRGDYMWTPGVHVGVLPS